MDLPRAQTEEAGDAAASLTLVSWNVDGFPRISASLPDIASRLGSPDVLCLQEVRLRPGDLDDVDALSKALPGFECHWSLSRDPINARFRGGRTYGVATYIRQSLSPVPAQTFEWDREGRFVVSRFPKLGLALGNVYAVNGTDKSYFDHELGRHEGTRHDFKRRFIARIAEACADYRAAGLDLILVGDWNVSRSRIDTVPRLRTEEPHARSRACFNDEFLPALDLIDVFREWYPDMRAYTWFNRLARGARMDAARVDFALLSRSLAGRVAAVGVHDAPEFRFGSDHAPIFVRLGTTRR